MVKTTTETKVFNLRQPASGGSRRANTRREIVAAARDLLADGASFSEMSVSLIAEQAGISRATFYLHFGDKRELLGDLATQELSEWRAVADPLLDDPTAGHREIERTIRALLDLWDQHRGVLSALIELAEYDEAARAAWRGAVESVAAAIAEYARRRDDVQVADPEMSALAIVWMTERVCHQVLDGATPDERDRLAATLTDVVWRSRKLND